MARGRYRIPIICFLIIAALLGAAFVLLPHPLVFAVTGEESTQSQLIGAAQWIFHWTRPLPQTANETPMAYTNLSPFGINTFLEQEVEPEKRERSLQLIAEAGFDCIRQEFPWEDIEIHGKGDFEDRRHEPYRSAWDKYDHIVNRAEHYDLQIIARLSNPPSWSRADGDAIGTYAPPDNLKDYGDYAEAVATRYQGHIRFYQIWNEPNIYPEWGNRPVDPAAYTELLCIAYQRIKAVDPNAVILSGAMAPTDQLGTPLHNGGNNLMDTLFLQQMYDAGAKNCFDIVAVNDYMLWSGPTDKRMRPQLINFSRPLWIRDVMVANGDAAKPVWITEMNSNAVPESIPANYGRVTEEQQARYAVQALERIQREWPWVGMVNIWFFKRASDLEKDQSWYYFRLVEPDFTPMPVYDALKSYLTTMTPTLYIGHHLADTWQITYHGHWEHDTRTGGMQGTSNDRLTLTWEGETLTLLPGEGESILHMTINGAPHREITLRGKPITLQQAHSKQRHTLTLTVIEGTASLKGFQVE